ncbi:MAG: AAA family ATPase [Deltaproteobacteria bacterium]|nr:AAA family ATPase [Deltaproteobacteria bacterium]
MIISHISLKNWRNFQNVEIKMGERVFLVGPNASGKSNFLDVFRFLRDIAKPEGGGLQKAVNDRGGISKIRCLAARRHPEIEIAIHLAESIEAKPKWKYEIGIKQQSSGHRLPLLTYERVYKGNDKLLDRPDGDDARDELRLTQTHLQQINANVKFREIVDFFKSILYLHLVPQLVRYPEQFSATAKSGDLGDPFGRNFLERVAKMPDKYRKSRLKKIETALRIAVPQLKELKDIKDESGVTHLEAVYEHWRPQGAKQREDQFSDGTLRLIGLLWSLLESDSLLLLEEPELSLNASIVAKLPAIFYRLQRQKKQRIRQLILSTHSADLLSDGGIGADEVFLLRPNVEGTKLEPASSVKVVRGLLDAGMNLSEAIAPHTRPPNISQLELFE